VGAAGSFAAIGSGTRAPTFSESGALPTGVTFAPDGQLSGIPGAGSAGTYPITITASNGVLSAAVQSFSLVVNAMGVTATSLLNGSPYTRTLKDTYEAILTASGGNPPYKWSLASGSTPLPPGLKPNAKGVLSCEPTTAGTLSFVGQVVGKKT